MSQRRSSLRIGNVISAALRIYRDHFKAYFGLSLTANLWLSLPFFALIIVSLLGLLWATNPANQDNIAQIFLSFLILIPLWLILAFYCTAKSLLNSALIARLTFCQLINRPETVTEARSLLESKLWPLWLTQFFVSLILSFVSGILQILQYFFFSLPASQVENLLFQTGIEGVGYLLYLIAFSWFSARFFLPDVCLAIESNITFDDTLSRSWKLTKGFAWQIILIIFLAILITLPVYLLMAIPLIFASVYAMAGLVNELPPFLVLSIISYSILGAILIFIVLNMAILPFWQALKGVIYYDLSSRQPEETLE